MLRPHRLLLLSGIFALGVAGCGSTSVGTESGQEAVSHTAPVTTPPNTPPSAAPIGDTVAGSDDSAAATSSVDGTISVAVGASQTISISFTSSDGKPMTGFAVSGSLGTLPAGWSGPASFTCATVAPGSGCVLALTYAPLVPDSSSLALTCIFVDNAKTPRTPGTCLTLSYASTASNNVVAAPSLAGEVDAVAGTSKQAVSVNFTTDDGNLATALMLTSSLSSLPAGWSSSATAFSCATVRTGNGCQLPLMFAPAGVGSGTLTLNYNYLDSSGAARTAALNIPYAGVTVGTVVAAVSPSGQVNAIENGGAAPVAVSFSSDDGNAATHLMLISDLANLPPGWSSTAKSFSCNSVGTGNGCQLPLHYAPSTLGSGTLTLRFAYDDEAGMGNTGLVNVAYAATTDDNVLGTAAPLGPIDVMVGATQKIAVTFATDDGREATALALSGNLSALPAGWSSSVATLSCASVSIGTGCELMLTYAPTAADSGTVALSFTYVNNAGEAKTGTVSIPYQATTNDNVLAAAPPSVAAVTGSSSAVTVTFTTDDGNVASALTADLSALPAAWSSATATFTCASVSTGSNCQLVLTYAPSAAANGTVAFGFNYTNDSGLAKSGSVSIPYSASP
jgi:hypothetical protein